MAGVNCGTFVQRLRPRPAATLAALTLAAVGLAGCLGLIRSDPRTLVLAPSQVPSSFALKAAGPYTNADVASAFSTSSTTVQGPLGRLGGYQTVYANSSSVLTSVVSLYRGASPAAKALALELSVNRKAHPTLTPLRVPRLGSQTYAFGGTVSSTTGQQVQVVTIDWREANALASITLAGPAADVSAQAAMRLATQQEGLLRKAV